MVNQRSEMGLQNGNPTSSGRKPVNGAGEQRGETKQRADCIQALLPVMGTRAAGDGHQSCQHGIQDPADPLGKSPG